MRLRIALTCALIAHVCVGAHTLAARSPQQGPVTHASEDVAPPPMKFVPAEIRAQLDAERDLKGRTRLSLELADQRLARAASETTSERYVQAGSELGIYQAVVEDAIRFLNRTGKVKNKSRDLFKRIELALRSHMPRLETIRRNTPSAYAVHVKEALEFVRESRTEALNSFYDDTVLREPQTPPAQTETPTGDDRAKGAQPPSTDKEKQPPRP
ncbi:MAG: hypothetical protein WCD76_05530 [Pyrinomonadaceae bacterium]